MLCLSLSHCDSIPSGAPPGEYVVHYSWGGYADCIDVELVTYNVPEIETYGEALPGACQLAAAAALLVVVLHS